MRYNIKDYIKKHVKESDDATATQYETLAEFRHRRRDVVVKSINRYHIKNTDKNKNEN